MRSNHKTIATKIVVVMFLFMVTAGLAVADESITGTIAEKGEHIVLDAADGSYILEGGNMISEMVGQKVTVTGTITEKENMRVIKVLNIKEVKE
ncbi:MAG: hypothetical protein CR984_03065 [Proteobacteria bacterium]|nr:MAG: hypothetical protein CR984_03065 [Pseudomonadota bacterium]